MALRVEGAPDGLAVSQVSITTTASQLVAARGSRRKLLVVGLSGFGNVYLGSDDTVSSSTGLPVEELSNPLELETAAQVWAVCSSGAATAVVVEFYDVED